MTVQLAFYKAKGKIGNAFIRWWTNSQYSHCEVVVDGVCYSSSVQDGGVRSKEMELKEDHWDIVDVPWGDEEYVKQYFKETDHHRYGWIGLLFNQFLNLNRDVSEAQFCSEWAARALKLPNPASQSPNSLYVLTQYLNSIRG